MFNFQGFWKRIDPGYIQLKGLWNLISISVHVVSKKGTNDNSASMKNIVTMIFSSSRFACKRFGVRIPPATDPRRWNK